MVSADLPSPVTVGWSGIDSSRISKWFLNKSMSPLFSLLRFSGRRLNIWAPLTPSDLSLAFLTLDGAALTTDFGITTLPLLLSPEVKLKLKPETNPWCLANLPDEYYLVTLSPSFLGVKLELL